METEILVFSIAKHHSEDEEIILHNCMMLQANGARQAQVNATIVDFYQNLFTSANPNNFEEVVDLIPQVVTNEMNQKLVADFTFEEVEVALKQMASLKAPDLDGNKEPELFAVVIWTLWNRRNNLRLGKPTLPLDKVLEFGQECMMGSETTNVPPLHPHGQSTTHWTTPKANGFKINFDDATFANKDSARIGVVIRNDAGLIMASLTQQIPLPTLVIEVEALVARRALEFALDLGFDDITLEGDSELLIKNLMNGGSKLTHYGNIAADILFLLSHFFKANLSFVRRHCNKLAHSLARRAIIPPIMSVWMEEIPSNLTSIFLVDLESLP